MQTNTGAPLEAVILLTLLAAWCGYLTARVMDALRRIAAEEDAGDDAYTILSRMSAEDISAMPVAELAALVAQVGDDLYRLPPAILAELRVAL